MAITEKEFYAPVGSHTDDEFAKLEDALAGAQVFAIKLKTENDALLKEVALKKDYIDRIEKGVNNG